MLAPIFVRGHLSFELDEHALEFIHQSISTFGVSGLPWAPLHPHQHFGRETEVTVRVPGSIPLVFKTRAVILRESTAYSEQLGLRFVMPDSDRLRLANAIRQHGFYPTDYVRKYPRIPSSDTIEVFPLRVIAEIGNTATREQVVFDVANLSPNGVLLKSESQLALTLRPGARINLTLEPRGWFPVPVKVEGLVGRISDDLHPVTGNIVRYLGVKFARVDAANKAAYLDLLREILSKLKS